MRGDEPAGLLLLEEVEAEAHEVPEHPHPQVAEERLADLRDQQDRRAGEEEPARSR